MFRSSRAALVGCTVALLGFAGVASADSNPSPSPSRSPATSGGRTATGPVLPLSAAVLKITAPVLDISFGSADLEGAATVEDSPRDVRVRLDSTVFFGKDSDVMRPGGRARLREVAATIRAKGPGRLAVVGYTDDLGSASHGLDLSRRRAAAVAGVLKPMLRDQDVRFSVKGRGEADPAVPNTSEAHRKKNRRVELTFRRAG